MNPLNKNRVVVAMSGGVDSSVAALLLKKQGYEVIGISMKTFENEENLTRHKSCCSITDIEDARRVASRIGIPFYAVNYAKEFKAAVIDHFVASYKEGKTPNPCIDCNRELKFATLIKEAERLGAYYLATGHYARKAGSTGSYEILRGLDPEKDQSYFLFDLSQDQLEHILFPVGDLNKAQVRTLAREAGLETSEKVESQEICFVTEGTLESFLNKRISPDERKPGNFVDRTGKVLGTHNGIHAFTIGQRRGLGIALGERKYIAELRPETGEIVLGNDEELFKKTVIAENPTFLDRSGIKTGMDVLAKVRYRQEAARAKLYFDETGEIKVLRAEFLEPQRAIAPGQAIVFYQDQKLLGGGWIQRGE